MNTSKHSDSDPHALAAPWHIERPPRERPPLGPEREAWLEKRLLYRSAQALIDVLDQIDPAIARNQPTATINEDAVAVALLAFLEPQSPGTGAPEGKIKRMPLHKARVFLRYFDRGFRSYCSQHGLCTPRLPLIRALAIDEGSLRADTFESLRQWRNCVTALLDTVQAKILEPTKSPPSPGLVSTLLVCSAAVFGGLAQRRHWEALQEKLAYPLERAGDLIAFHFDEPSPYRWIADPVTEALLRRFWHHGLLPARGKAKLPAPLIKEVLQLPGPAGKTLLRLEEIVRAAHVRHFAPDVAAIAQGQIPNTALAEEPWLRLLSGRRHPAERTKVSITLPHSAPAAPPETLEQVALQQVIDAIAKAVRWDAAELRKRADDVEGVRDGHGVQRYFANARAALRAAEGELEQIYLQTGYPGAHVNSFTFGLLRYAQDLMELGGQKVRQLAPSTIDHYVRIVRIHLPSLKFSDLVAIGTQAREEAYRTNIRQQLILQRADHRTAFEGFERSLLRHMEMIDEVDWATIPGRANERHLPKVDANVVDPALYRHVFHSLDAPSQKHPIALIARALLLVLYRFGLRTGEAWEVTAGSLVLHADQRASLRVRRSKITSRKSGNAIRLVGPIELPEDEYMFIKEYKEQRAGDAVRRGRDRATAHLFATRASNSLAHVETAQQLLTEMLRGASGDTHLRPRHLRHSFVSGCFLAGRDPLQTSEPVEHSQTSSGAWGRTFSTGHASPETGIVSYTHTVELAHYHYACRMVEAEVPSQFLSRLANKEDRTLERATHRSGQNRSAAFLFREAVRRGFPCSDVHDWLNSRTRYSQVELASTAEPVLDDNRRLSWDIAWAVYASARIGRVGGNPSDHAQKIRQRVRELEAQGLLRTRLKRRPQLGSQEAAAAAALWQQLPGDRDLKHLLSTASGCLRNRGGQLLLPAHAARQLEQLLQNSGLVRLESQPAKMRQRWLRNPGTDGKLDTAWIELLAFLYAALT